MRGIMTQGEPHDSELDFFGAVYSLYSDIRIEPGMTVAQVRELLLGDGS